MILAGDQVLFFRISTWQQWAVPVQIEAVGESNLSRTQSVFRQQLFRPALGKEMQGQEQLE
jgi:hypothetical protein